MASEKSTLTVIRLPAAIDELHEVWQWNARHSGLGHADQYLSYLNESIADLATQYAEGKTVGKRPDLRYILIREKMRGHGHVAVYTFDAQDVHLVHIFHTAQDWHTNENVAATVFPEINKVIVSRAKLIRASFSRID